MKKILILSMSCQHEFFLEQENVVRETWAKPIIEGKYENIKFLLYRGGYEKNSYSKNECCLKLNVEDDIQHTFKKTYFALSMAFKNFGEFDYVFRTNTSTYVNVELLNAYIQQLEDDESLYSGDIYSLSELKCPYPLSLTCRGNALIMSKKIVERILKHGIGYLYRTDQADDACISTILNSWWIENGQDYKKYLKSFRHCWYKCIEQDFNNGNQLCGYGNTNISFDFLKDFITIQIRNYGDLLSFKYRTNESEKMYEIDKVFKNNTNSDIADSSIKLNKDRETNYDIFIGSLLNYISYDKWLSLNKQALYDYEITHKASDDSCKDIIKDIPFIYVDYYYNNTKQQLI